MTFDRRMAPPASCPARTIGHASRRTLSLIFAPTTTVRYRLVVLPARFLSLTGRYGTITRPTSRANRDDHSRARSFHATGMLEPTLLCVCNRRLARESARSHNMCSRFDRQHVLREVRRHQPAAQQFVGPEPPPGAREDPKTQVVSGEGNIIDKILWLMRS